VCHESTSVADDTRKILVKIISVSLAETLTVIHNKITGLESPQLGR
jgi:hypothetical protein